MFLLIQITVCKSPGSETGNIGIEQTTNIKLLNF